MRIVKILFTTFFFSAVLCGLFAKEKTKITIAVGSLGKDLDVTKTQAKEFMKLNPDFEVEVLQMSSSSDEILAYYLQQIQAKSGAVDIFTVDIAWIGDIQNNLLDLSKYGLDKLSSKMFPVVANAGYANGKMVALPWFSDTALLYYRKDLLKKYNLEVPETWLDLTKTAYKIQTEERKAGNKDFVGYVWQANAYEGLTCAALELIASNNGGTIVSDNKKVTLSNPDTLQILTLAKNWIGSISPKGVLQMNEEKSRAVFQSGNAAFMRNWAYAYVLGNTKDSPVKDKFDISILPKGVKGESKNCLGGWYLAINKYSKNPDAAAKFISYMDNSEMQKYRLGISGQTPTIMSVYDDKLFKKSPQYKVIFDGLKHAVVRPSTVTAPNYNEVSKVFYKSVYDALAGNKDISSAIAEAAKQVSTITKFPEQK